MKVFHINDQGFKIPPLGETYPEETRKYWGHIVTNKANRNNQYFAFLLDPGGHRCHQISYATYTILISGISVEHVHPIKPISSEDFEDEILPCLFRLNKKQVKILLEKLAIENQNIKNINFHTMCDEFCDIRIYL